MSTGVPLLAGAGALPEQRMREACAALAEGLGHHLQHHGIGESPQQLLAQISPDSLVRLSGDPARPLQEGGNWLEALADWRRPLLLLVLGEPGGGIAGAAAAYTALCRELGVPLVGLIQIGGDWDLQQRRRDGLPWCGWIPAASHPDHDLAVDGLVQDLRRNTIRARAKAVG